MASVKFNRPSSKILAHHTKEIDALLHRLHTGCRFITFEDDGGSRKGSGRRYADISNFLRNASPSDETHAELGRALAHSYLKSIHSSSLKDGSSEGAVIELGERIIRSLCCGEDVSSVSTAASTTSSLTYSSSGAGSELAKSSSERANYASVAYAFFGHLQSYFLNKDDEDAAAAIHVFLVNQLQKWCILCEELVVPSRDDGGIMNGGGGGIHVLHACVNSVGCIGYSCLGGLSGEDEECLEISSNCAALVYESLSHSSSRKYLIRTYASHAFTTFVQSINNDGNTATESSSLGQLLVNGISSLFHSCVLSARKASAQTGNYVERRLLLQEVLRGCSTLLDHAMMASGTTTNKNALHQEKDRNIIQIVNEMIQYLTQSLSSYLKQDIQLSLGKNYGDMDASNVFELGYDWLRGICDLITKVMPLEGNHGVSNAVTSSLECLLSTILPQFTTSSTATFDMSTVYSALIICVSLLPPSDRLPLDEATVILRLGSLALNIPNDSNVGLICDLMLATFKNLDESNAAVTYSTILTGGMLMALGCVFRCLPVCLDSASRLRTLGESLLNKISCEDQSKEAEEKASWGDGMHLMDIILYSMCSGNFHSLMDIVSTSISDKSPPCRPLSLSDQCSGLLLGLALIHISASPCQTIVETDQAFAFLRSFLQCYPRMAPRVVPSIVQVARMCQEVSLIQNMPAGKTPLLNSLEFLASPCIVIDPHGAHLAWTFLSTLAAEGMPTSVRSSIIRLLPEMCSSNKRLFRRARDVIGKSMVAQDPIIRISATAALSEMANLDLLRDVEQIVGWIQNRLSDEETAVVHYALETLRYLVVNEELEFDLVFRVLEKRLNVDLSNADAVLDLDVLVLEGLVAFMGEGGLEEEDDDDEPDDEDDAAGPEVSPQSVKAVSLLLELALSTHPSIKDDIQKDKDTASLSNARIQRRIYGSLSGYSSQVLGLDEETIRSWDGSDSLTNGSDDLDPEIQRFLNLKDITLKGMDFAMQLHSKESLIGEVDEVSEIAADLLKSVTSIGKTLLQFEEEVHGSFLFRGSNATGEKSSKGKSESRARASKSVLSSLPTASTIQDMYESDPRSSSATALFYSIDSSESNATSQANDILGQMSECFGDIANEPLVDPAFQAIQICSLMHCMDTVWQTIMVAEENERGDLLDQVVAQTEEWSETYGGEYAYLDMAAFSLSVDAVMWPGATNIQNTILEGQENYIFESEDTKLLCLSMMAARLGRTADARVTGLIDSIEKSLLEHSRQTCFGALFGLGLLAANLMVGNISGTDPSDRWRRQQARRIVCILLSAFNSCLDNENAVVASLVSSIKCGEVPEDLLESCTKLDLLYVKDGSAQKMKSIMIGLSHSFPALTATTNNYIVRCVFCVIDKLPWGSGKSYALNAGYKNALDSGIMEQADLPESIATTSRYIEESGSGFGDALLLLALLCRLSNEKNQKEYDLIAKTCQKVLLDKGTHEGGEDKMMAILAGCIAIGDLPGIGSFKPSLSATVKKNFVADVVKTLEEIALNNEYELKYRDAATVGLGILCAMRNSSNDQKQSRKTTTNKFENIQGKDGSLMQEILKEVEKAFSDLCSLSSGNDTGGGKTVNKLCTLFSMLEPIAMPGNFSRIIELTLNASPTNEVELKATATKLLVSQLDPGLRRIGFDGRGFVDLSTRLAKMPPSDLRELVGPNATSIMATSLPNLLSQIPTSVGADVANSLWAICRADLSISVSSSSVTEFFAGLTSILTSVNTEGKPHSKRTISPALLRNLQKLVLTNIFSDLCADAVPSSRNSTEDAWTSYLQCLEHVPSDMIAEAGPNCDIALANVFGVSSCASLSRKSTRKVEYWMSIQEMEGLSMASLQIVLLSTLSIATQGRNDIDMKESVLSIFEVMLVKGIDTMALYLLAAKIAIWWESRQMHQLEYVNMSLCRVSSMTSFFVTRNLCFDVHALTPELLAQLFHSFIDDLPCKLALLSKIWKISDEVSNRASRVWYAHASLGENSDYALLNHRRRSLSCLRETVHLIDGGS